MRLAALTSWALLRSQLGRIASGLGFSVVVALATSAYAYLSGPLLALLLSGGSRGGGMVARMIPERFAALIQVEASGGTPGILWVVALLLVLVAALKGGAQLAQTGLISRATAEIGWRLRGRVYSHLLRLPLVVHRRLTAGDLLARLIDDVARVEGAVVEAPLILAREGIAALALLALIIAMAGSLALVALVTLPLTGLVIHVVGRRVKRHATRGQRALGAFSQGAAEGLRAVRELKSLGAEGRHAARVAAEAEGAGRWRWRQAMARAVSPLFNEVAGALALGGALIYAGSLVARQAIAASTLVSLLTALLLLYRPLKGIGNAVSQIAAGRASVERLSEILRLRPEAAIASPPSAPALARHLALAGVGYRHGDRWIFRDLDLTLRLGELVAIRGVSGAGKSTLLDVLAGLEVPAAGHVAWDDEVFSSAETIQLRGRVALVPQQPLLLPGTVADNLRYAAHEVDEARLWEVLEAAELAERCRRLPDGLASPIGPGSGAGLSVGEIQRLALARALLQDRPVLLLDEPSSALDEAQEARLLCTLKALKAGRVIVFVSHRPLLLEGADRVVELRDGKLRATPLATP